MRLAVRALALVTATVWSGLVLVSAGQRDAVPGAPPAAATVVTGTGTLSGRVVADAEGRRPVRRAIVTLAGGELPRSVSTITDDDGRFRFDEVPAGRFSVTASRAAYLTTAFGARRPGRPGTPVSVAAGQRIENVVFRMPPGGVITGTIRDPHGESLAGVSVVAGRSHLDRPGAGQSTYLGQNVTDDRGVYRLYGLEPGQYYVGAILRLVNGVHAALTEPEITASIAQLQRTAPTPGRSAPAPAPASSVRVRPHALAPIFFPGTADFSQAQTIPLEAGEERGGVDLVMRAVPAARVSGVVSPAFGELPQVQLGFASDTIVQLSGYTPPQPTLVRAPGPDGRFEYTGVIPGRYTITARARVATSANTAGIGGGGGGRGAGPPSSTVTQWASATIVVGDTDVEGVAMTLGPGLTLRGRLEFDGRALTPPESITDIGLSLQPRREGGLTMINGVLFGTQPPPPATMNGDRTFTFTGLMPGVYQISSTLPAGKGWWMRSAIADGVDILDVPLEIGTDGRLPSSIVVTYSDRQTELGGVLQTTGGAPAPDYFIIAFSTDERTWRPQARRLASTRPATDGTYVIRGLPPGEYYLAALTDLDPAEWQTPVFLKQIAPASLRFTVTDGQTLRQDLRLQ